MTPDPSQPVMITLPASRHVHAGTHGWVSEDDFSVVHYADLHVGRYRIKSWPFKPSRDTYTPPEFLVMVRDFVADKVRLLFTPDAEREFGERASWAPELDALLGLGNPDLAASIVTTHPSDAAELRRIEQEDERSGPSARVLVAPEVPLKRHLPRRTALYRHLDADDVLLYVGISGNLAARDEQHAGGSVWHLFVARVESVLLDTRDEALQAETAAIETEVPIFNKKKAPAGRERRIEDYLTKRGRLDLLSEALK